MNKLYAYCIIVILSLTALLQVCAVQLAWDPSPDANVTGYKIYYGTNSGSYQIIVDVGNVTNTTITLTNYAPITTYFIATAYTVEGVESLPSNEVSYAAPKPKPSPPTNLRTQ